MATAQSQVITGHSNQAVIPDTHPQQNFQHAKYANLFSKLGILQIVFGCLSIFLGIALIICAAYSYNYYGGLEYIGTGIWCGIFFLISGILGKVSARKQESCPVVGAMVMTIFSALAATTLLGMEFTGVIISTSQYHPYYHSYPYITALHSILCVIALGEFVTAVIHSACCCAAARCCSGNTNQQEIVTPANFTFIPNTVLPAHGNTHSHVTQPHHGTPGQNIYFPFQYNSNYQTVANQPIGVAQNNNMMREGASTMNQPPPYQDLEKTTYPQRKTKDAKRFY